MLTKFFQTAIALSLVSYGANTLVSDKIEDAQDILNSEKAKAVKSVMKSVSEPVTVGDTTIQMDGDDVDIKALYSLAQEEADKMLATGDVSTLQKQMEENQDIMNIFGAIDKAGSQTGGKK